MIILSRVVEQDYLLEHDLTNNVWLNLAYAIVIQATKDYRHYKKFKQNDMLNHVAKFFSSDWFSSLTMDRINGKAVLEVLEKEKEE